MGVLQSVTPISRHQRAACVLSRASACGVCCVGLGNASGLLASLSPQSAGGVRSLACQRRRVDGRHTCSSRVGNHQRQSWILLRH
jgi:hypothetical protein